MQIFGEEIFENPIEKIIAFDNESFIKAFSRIENLRKTHYLLGYIRYESKDVFLGTPIKSDLPLLYFEAYKKGRKKSKEESGFSALSHCQKQGDSNTAVRKIVPKIEFKTYSNAIREIKKEIANGNTYELNYTYDWTVSTDSEGLELFNSILSRQKTPYNAYIKNEHEEILSFSPELFFELNNNKIRTKPMKGTIARGETEAKDKQNVDFLKTDEKNKAENIMIVDLLRNDLGKIAKTGTVKVDKLFEIETHKTVHQMTSEISAELREDTTLFEIFDAIFPCGSITGAPKINTMEIIDRIEIGQRGVYCGAIGLISPQKTVFSVPIRMLQRKNENQKTNTELLDCAGNNKKKYTCRVGGGIVWDSTAEDEWQETLTKINFLNTKEVRSYAPNNTNSDNIQLFETMLVKNGEIENFEEHLARIQKSAKELGFELNNQKAYESSIMAKNQAKRQAKQILRLLLNKNNFFETQILPLNEIKTNKVIISKTPIDSNETLLYHKTTHRPWYEESMKKIKNDEIFDEIFTNERGEITEGARSNIIIQINGELLTPPVKCGLLSGITREKMLKNGEIKEQILYLKDLQKAEKVFCINSLRGIVEIALEPTY